MAKPVISTKRFSFEHLLDGWTDEHFIEYRPFSYAEAQSIKGMKEDGDGVDSFADLIKSHFVKGAWLVSDDDGSNVRTEPMEKENVTDIPMDVLNAFIKAAMGGDAVSPKPKAN